MKSRHALPVFFRPYIWLAPAAAIDRSLCVKPRRLPQIELL
jgi:hypothetical protein